MKDFDLKEFGLKIKIERIRNSLSQEELAELVGVSTRTISLIENGLQHPKFFTVEKLSMVLKVDINHFCSSNYNPQK